MKQVDLAWATGLYEGEGTMGCYRGGRKNRPRSLLSLRMGMTDRPPLARFARIFGAKVKGPYVRPGKNKAGEAFRSVYTVSFSGSAAVRVFQLMRPQLSRRRQRQGDTAIATWEAR